MSAGFGDYGTADLARFRKFIENIARMNYDGEELHEFGCAAITGGKCNCVEDGEPAPTFVMENDDAVDTLNGLINQARELTK